MSGDFVPHPNRRSIRLTGYDYTQAGVYFVTLCAHERACLFGAIVGETMQLNPFGEVVREEWLKTASIRREVELDEFVVMPNHFHALVWIVSPAAPTTNTDETSNTPNVSTTHDVGAHGRAPLQPPTLFRAPKSLGALIAGFKSAVTRRINTLRDTPGVPVWQRNYYEHIIRNDDSLNACRLYIQTNPACWAADREYVPK